MHLRLLQTGNRTEEILDAAGITGHGVGFQFTDIDNVICLHDGRDQVKTVVLESGGTVDGLRGKIHIQFGFRTKRIHATDMVDMLHGFGIVETAGTLGDGDMLHALFP